MAEEKSKITVAVRDKTGQSVGSVNFDADELAPGINKQLLHDVVVMYEANRRVGTVQNRNRAQTEGSTKKLYRQKGTGRARAGTQSDRQPPARRTISRRLNRDDALDSPAGAAK